MLDYSALNKYDPSGMHKIYDKWPDIAREFYEHDNDLVDFKEINYIVFAGMGGSGIVGDIFFSILSNTKVHVSVVKGYHLPKTVDPQTLVVTTSVSGNTAETLAVLNLAKESGSKVIAFSSGGKMQSYCNENKILYKNIKSYNSPRASLPSFLYSMLKLLGPTFKIKKEDVSESIKLLESMQKQIGSHNLNIDNPSLSLAEWISGIPLTYYPFGLYPAAIRFKNSLQENVKIHAMAEDIFEASHNGIVSWERPSNVQPILIQGADDHIKTKERWQILKEYFKINHIDYREVFSCNGSILSKLVNLIYMLDYSTIYRSLLSKMDPSPISSIDFIKSKL
ncbi:MAG: SIS domain-containing protein [Nitrosopumilaceae archaeon]